MRAAAIFLALPALWAAVASSSHTSRDQDAEAYSAGLRLWRTPGRIQDGAACGTCHSPDGIEIAAYAFDDADIYRRASAHLSDEDSNRIVAFIHAVRRRYRLAPLLDPFKDRPLQPGGAVLEGSTPEERDKAFGQELKEKLPTLFGPRIETVAQAKEAERQMLALDPNTLRFGIPLNRLSEDVAHGQEHASIAQWLPELPPTIPPDQLASWYRAEDAYLADPTSWQLRSLIAAHERLMGYPNKPGMYVLGQFKFRALLVLQHRLRTKQPPKSPVADEVGRPASPGLPNPIWQVGETTRDIVFRTAPSLGFTPDLAAKKETGGALGPQLHDLRLSWMWLGWLQDQGLNLTSGSLNVRLGLWLDQSLWEDGPYPIHGVYAEARRQLVVSTDPGSWSGMTEYRRLFWDYPGIRAVRGYLLDPPADPVHRSLLQTFTANCFRMSLLLLKDDLVTTNTVWIRENSQQNVKVLCRYLLNVDPESAKATEQLRDDLVARIRRARDRYPRLTKGS